MTKLPHLLPLPHLHHHYPFFPETDHYPFFLETDQQRSIPIESSEEIVIQIPNSIVHLINKQHSVELASGVLEIIRLRQSSNVVAILARIGDDIQWSLAKDEAAVKLDGTHYFFTLRVPSESGNGVVPEEDNIINYSLTITGDVVLGEQLDRVLDEYSACKMIGLGNNWIGFWMSTVHVKWSVSRKR